VDDLIVNLDWTVYDKDGHSQLVLSLQTNYGRAMPLIWATVETASLKDQQNTYEDNLLVRFRQVMPEGVRVTVVADRGFSDQQLYVFLQKLDFDYIIRFRSGIYVTDSKGNKRKAKELVRRGGRLRVFRGALVAGKDAPGCHGHLSA